MKNQHTMMIRYMGPDHARRHVIQRGDGSFWTGEAWSKILDNAQLFDDHKTAGLTVVAIQHKRWKGKPCRTFKVEVSVTLVGDDIQNMPVKDLAKYLADAVRLDVETSIFGEGPVDGSFVQARMNLSKLEETPSNRKVY